MEPLVNIRLKGGGGTHQVPLSEVNDYVSKLRQTYRPLIDRAKRIEAHFKARRGDDGYQVGGEVGIRDILAQASQWLSESSPSEEVLKEFGQDITPIWGDLRALGRAKEMIETPIDPTQFIRNGEFDLQAYNKAHYDKGAELGLELTSGVPILGLGAAGLKFALKDGRLLNVLADEAGRTTMRNQLGMLAGPNAKNADLAMLAKAQEMKARGLPTDDIYSETKWWLDHPDGVPRFEIDDSGARFNKSFVDFDQIDADIRVRQQQLEGTQEAGREALAARDMDKYKNEIKPMIDYLEGDIARLKNSYEIGQGQEFGGLGDFMSHYKSYENYPDTKDIYTITDPMASGGSFQEKLNQMRIGGRAGQDEAKSTALHELQHAIQSREGMARGGSPDMFGVKDSQIRAAGQQRFKTQIGANITEFLRENGVTNTRDSVNTTKLNRLMRDYADSRAMDIDEAWDGLVTILGDDPNIPTAEVALSRVKEAEDVYGKLLTESITQESGFDQYKRLAGEADARLVQNRMNMSMDERLANPFYKGYDVPIEDQIIRFDDGTSMSTKSQLGAVDLPMDEASRMARAREMGFDTEQVLYHGSPVGKNIKAFDLDAPMQTDYGFLGNGVYTSPKKWLANAYTRGDYDGDVLELLTSSKKIKDFNYYPDQDAYHNQIKEWADELGVKSKWGTKEWARELREKASLKGWDGARGLNQDGSIVETSIYNTNQLRKKDAKFDPAKKDSADLLASKLLPIPAGLLGLTTLDPDN